MTTQWRLYLSIILPTIEEIKDKLKHKNNGGIYEHGCGIDLKKKTKIVEIYSKTETDNNKQPSCCKLAIEAKISIRMACKVINQVKFNNITHEKEGVYVYKSII